MSSESFNESEDGYNIQGPPIEAFQTRICLSGGDSDDYYDDHGSNDDIMTNSMDDDERRIENDVEEENSEDDGIIEATSEDMELPSPLNDDIDLDHENKIEQHEKTDESDVLVCNTIKQDDNNQDEDDNVRDTNDISSCATSTTPRIQNKRFMEEVRNVDELVSKYFPDDDDNNNGREGEDDGNNNDQNRNTQIRFTTKGKKGYDKLSTVDSSSTSNNDNVVVATTTTGTDDETDDSATTIHGGRSNRVQTVMITAGEGIKEILYRANEATRAAFHVNNNNNRTYHPYLDTMNDATDDDDDDDITEVTGNLSPKRGEVGRSTSERLRDALRDDDDESLENVDDDDDDDLDFDQRFELALPTFDHLDDEEKGGNVTDKVSEKGTYEKRQDSGSTKLSETRESGDLHKEKTQFRTQKSGESSVEQIHSTSNIDVEEGSGKSDDKHVKKSTTSLERDYDDDNTSTNSCYLFNEMKGTTTIKSKFINVVDKWLEQRGQKSKPSRKARRGSGRQSTYDKKRKVIHDLSKYGSYNHYKSARSFDSSDDINPDDEDRTTNNNIFKSLLYRGNKRVTRATTLIAVVTCMIVISIGAFVYQAKENTIYHFTGNSNSYSSNSDGEESTMLTDDDEPPLSTDVTIGTSSGTSSIHDHIEDAFAPVQSETNTSGGGGEQSKDSSGMVSLMDILQKHTSIDVLMDPSTPQYRARMSMGSTEINTTSQTSTQEEKQALISRGLERYALLTIFYALGGDNVDGPVETTSGTLTMMVGVSSSFHNKSPWKNSSGWASTHNTDMCLWYGITCNPTSMRVQNISLRDNGLKGTIPSELSLLEMLETIDLTSNWIEGYVPNDISKLKQLRIIRLSDNNLVVPSSLNHVLEPFTNIIPLEELELNNNNIQGPFLRDTDYSATMNGLASLSKLSVLSMAGNQLTGPIPDEIGYTLSSLKELDLSGNYFSSSFPPSVGKLTKLFLLDLSENSLEGELPQELMQLEDLHVLRLNKNQFGGRLPSYILHELISLEELNLSHNNFEGSINTDLGLLTSLEALHIEGNALLTGTMPSSICNLQPPRGELTILTVDCQSVECQCCTCIPP